MARLKLDKKKHGPNENIKGQQNIKNKEYKKEYKRAKHKN